MSDLKRALADMLNMKDLAQKDKLGMENKELANAQILDYLAGDKENKIGRQSVPVNLDNMMVITEELTDALNRMMPDQLNEFLSGAGIDQSEIVDCQQRLALVKNRIKAGEPLSKANFESLPSMLELGKLCAVKDDAWEELDPYDLSRPHKHFMRDQAMRLIWTMYYAQDSAEYKNYFGAQVAYLYNVEAPSAETDWIAEALGGHDFKEIMGSDFALAKASEWEKNAGALDRLMGDMEHPAPPLYADLKQSVDQAAEVNREFAAKGQKQMHVNDNIRVQAKYDNVVDKAKLLLADHRKKLKAGIKIKPEDDARAKAAEQVMKNAAADKRQLQAAEEKRTEQINMDAMAEVMRFKEFADIMRDYEVLSEPTAVQMGELVKKINAFSKKYPEPCTVYLAIRPRLEKVIMDVKESAEGFMNSGLGKQDLLDAQEVLKKCEREEDLTIQKNAEVGIKTPKKDRKPMVEVMSALENAKNNEPNQPVVEAPGLRK